MIHFSHVSKQFNQHIALSNVSFDIARGEMAFLTGHSGAGKSTVLKLIMRMEIASRGQIIVNQQSLQNLSSREIPYLRRRIGMIFQDPQLLHNRTVFENVAIPLIITGFRKRDMQRRVHAALDKVGLLSKANLLPSALSSGEQQRVGIARAVVNKPDVLLADEPTGNLDPDLSLEIFDLFKAFHAVGVTVLIATHDLPLIARMSYRMITLQDGTVVE